MDGTTDFLAAIGSLVLFSIPLALSVWALVDAARRPGWVWALAGRRQVVWLALILFGTLTVLLGIVISLYYLIRIRPRLAAIEDGDLTA